MTRRDQRLVQSEAAIMEAGIRTFVSNPSAGMSEIALASGVGRTTLYRHYPSREALIQAIALQCLDEIDAALAPLYESDDSSAIATTLAVLIPIADRFRFLSVLWADAERNPRVVERMEESRRDTRALMDYAKTRGEVASDLPSEWLAEFFEMTLYAAWSLVEQETLTSEDAARFATQSFLHGCGP